MTESASRIHTRLPPFVHRVRKAVDETFTHYNIPATSDQKSELVARIFGYKTWDEMWELVAKRQEIMKMPGILAGNRPLVSLFNIPVNQARYIAQHIREGYEFRNTTLSGLGEAIDAQPDVGAIGIEDLSLKPREVRLLQAKGVTTLLELNERKHDLDPDVMANILKHLIIPKPAD